MKPPGIHFRFSPFAFGFFLLLGLALGRPASADPLYQNYADLNYVIPGYPPPMIDGKNYVTPAFDNEGQFDVTFAVLTADPEYYEAMNMLYYTNNGTMLADSSFSTIGLYEVGYSPGCGFQFDLQTTNVISRTLADTFYNAGTIHCNSLLDPNTEIVSLLGECLVSATNVVNPGVVEVGPEGLIQFTGQNVDLTSATLDVEAIQDFYTGYANISAVGAIGLDTNADWNPGADLGANYAYSSWSGGGIYPGGYYLYDNASTAYYQEVVPDTNTTIYRFVFVQNASPNAAYNVYFDGAGFGLGSGEANVEWVGSYVDPATGNSATHYLYLNDDYVWGASTNVSVVGGLPNNFTFTESANRLFAGTLTASGFLNVFPNITLSNYYAYVNAQLVSTSVPTNATVSNPHGALTNLPARIQISASRELNLALAVIAGPNYMSLTCTNQFDGNTGAQILSPYSDFYLGVTNGNLTFTNLVAQSLPDWCGTVQAWSTRWLTLSTSTNITIDTNGVVSTNTFTFTNDFRVMIVNSQLTPTAPTYVQDLVLHATNSLVLSDALNILRTLSIDATNLTLTTNSVGNGASSLDGELNLMTSAILWQSALPNVRNLTNNGAIRTKNLALFGSATPTYTTNITPAIAATATLYETDPSNTISPAGTWVTIGTNYTYTFADTITNTVRNQVKVGATLDGSMSNLIAAINHAAGSGTGYSTNTSANPFVTAGLLTDHSFTVTAKTNGSSGKSIENTTSAIWFMHWGDSMSGGADIATNIVKSGGPYGAFINNGLLSDQGSTIYADNFLSSGVISNGVGSFLLHSLTTTLTNGSIIAGGDISITASSLVTSNLVLQAGRSLTLQVTNLLTDTGVSNGNAWSVGGASLVGLNLPLLPANNPPDYGDLLGTTISCVAPAPNKQVVNTWAALDRGVSVNGYHTNVAVGRLILDAQGVNSSFKFNGTSGTSATTNALYVDELVLLDYASYTNHDSSGNLPALVFNTNVVIYYAQAILADGTSVAGKINQKNTNHLRWVPMYAGYFSSTNLVYPDGTTNTFNAALMESSSIDSDGDGNFNNTDPTPIFVAGQMNFKLTLTNQQALLSWQSVPGATNYIEYKTNLMSAAWINLATNITSGSSAMSRLDTNPVGSSVSRFYRLRMDQNSTQLYGPGF
jgi:hypothetical protein